MYSQNNEAEEIVDVDAAINGTDYNSEYDKGNPDPYLASNSLQNPESSYLDTQEQDTSFGSDRIPVGLDQSDGWQDNDPLPMGDEVSMGVISRESENYRNNQTPVLPMPSANPNRVTGRRGGRQGGSRASSGTPMQRPSGPVNGFPQPPSQPESANLSDISYSYRSVQRERIEVPVTRVPRNPAQQFNNSSSSSYRTKLGNQSMI